MLLGLAGASSARADCLPVGGTSFVCSGLTTVPQVILTDDAAVTTAPGFSVNATAGIPALAIGGNGTISYFDNNGSALASDDAVLYVENFGTGAGEISVISNGAITGGGAVAGAVTVTNAGVGATTVSLSGPVNADVVGVFVENSNFLSTGAVAVTTGTVNAGLIGVYARNAGTGALEIATNGAVAAGAFGIWAEVGFNNLDGINVNAQTVTGDAGIVVFNDGMGETKIKVAGTATAAGLGIAPFGLSGVAVLAEVTDTNNTGGLALDVANANGAFAGISAVNDGVGGTRVTATGLVTSANGPGVAVLASNAANANDVLVDVNSVSGHGMGILVANDGTGTSRITVGGVVEAETAIIADSLSGAAFALTINGEVRSTLGASGLAIDATAPFGLAGPTLITNNNRLTGRVELSDFDDVLTNAGLWDVAGTSTFELGNDSVVNQAGGTLRAARLAPVAEATRLLGLESFSGGGTVSLADGGTGDTMEIDGNAVFAPTAVHEVDVGAAADSFVIGGTADLADATLRVALQQGYVVGQTFAILNAAGGVTGQYGQLEGSTAYLQLVDSYDANNAYVQAVQGQALSAPGRTPNQLATAKGLESLALNHPVVMALLLNAKTDDEARAMLDRLSGEIHGSVQSALLQESRLVREAVLAHLRSSLDGAGSAPVLAYAANDQALAWEPELTQIWSEAIGSWGRAPSDGNAAEMETRAGGLLAGADSMVGDWRVGLLLGYGSGTMAVPGTASSADGKTYQVGLYGGTAWGDVAFRTGMAYAWNDINSTRTVVSGGTQTLTAHYGTSAAQAFGELAYSVDLGSSMLEPFANAAVVGTQSAGFTEQGGSAALSTAGSSHVAAFTTLGLRAVAKFIAGETTLVTVSGSAGWRLGLGGAPQVQNNFAGGTGFSIAGGAVSGSAVVFDAAVDAEFSDQLKASASYSSVIGPAQFDQSIKGALTMRF